MCLDNQTSLGKKDFFVFSGNDYLETGDEEDRRNKRNEFLTYINNGGKGTLKFDDNQRSMKLFDRISQIDSLHIEYVEAKLSNYSFKDSFTSFINNANLKKEKENIYKSANKIFTEAEKAGKIEDRSFYYDKICESFDIEEKKFLFNLTDAFYNRIMSHSITRKDPQFFTQEYSCYDVDVISYVKSISDYNEITPFIQNCNSLEAFTWNDVWNILSSIHEIRGTLNEHIYSEKTAEQIIKYCNSNFKNKISIAKCAEYGACIIIPTAVDLIRDCDTYSPLVIIPLVAIDVLRDVLPVSSFIFDKDAKKYRQLKHDANKIKKQSKKNQFK